MEMETGERNGMESCDDLMGSLNGEKNEERFGWSRAAWGEGRTKPVGVSPPLTGRSPFR